MPGMVCHGVPTQRCSARLAFFRGLRQAHMDPAPGPDPNMAAGWRGIRGRDDSRTCSAMARAVQWQSGQFVVGAQENAPNFPRNSRCVRNCSQSDVRGLAARGTNLLPWCASAAIAQGVLSCCVCLCRGASSAQQGSATMGVLAIALCRGCAVVIGRAVVSASRAPSPIRPYPCDPRSEQALCSPALCGGGSRSSESVLCFFRRF